MVRNGACPRSDIQPDDRDLIVEDRRVDGIGWPFIQEFCDGVDDCLKGTTNMTTRTVKLDGTDI